MVGRVFPFVVNALGRMIVHGPAAVSDDVRKLPLTLDVLLGEDIIAFIADVLALSRKGR